ncbi:unnamed protein product [Closterium sp. Naga37s-1]|nr:unnamed protein product [Closterium sp. Naga37s-1]
MPPRARPVKPANKMVTDDAAAAAATLKSPAAGPSARPASVTAVPSKSSRTLFAKEDSESLTLSAKLAALRIEQAAGGKADKGKAKDTDFKDAVSDAEDDAAGDEDQDAPDAARRVNFMDDEDDGLQAHDPKECFEDKAKEDLAAKLRFPLTLLIPIDEKYIVLDWLYPEDPGYTRRKITDPAVIEVLFLGVAAEISPEMLHEALAISPLKICKRPAFKEGFHFHRVVHPVSGLDTDWVKGLVVAHENDQFRWLHWIILKDPALVLVSTAGNREEWVCLLECCEKAKGSSFEQAAHHALSQRHRGGLGKQGAATRVLKDKLNLRVLRKEYGI